MINRTEKWKSYAVKLVECLEAAHDHIDAQHRVIAELKETRILGTKIPRMTTTTTITITIKYEENTL